MIKKLGSLSPPSQPLIAPMIMTALHSISIPNRGSLNHYISICKYIQWVNFTRCIVYKVPVVHMISLSSQVHGGKYFKSLRTHFLNVYTYIQNKTPCLFPQNQHRAFIMFFRYLTSHKYAIPCIPYMILNGAVSRVRGYSHGRHRHCAEKQKK